MAAMTSQNYANDLKLKSDHLHVCRTHCVKFQSNRSSSLATRQVTISVFQNGGHDVIHYANELKAIHKQLDVCRTICAKFQQNRPNSIATNPLKDFLAAILKIFQLQAAILDRSY